MEKKESKKSTTKNTTKKKVEVDNVEVVEEKNEIKKEVKVDNSPKRISRKRKLGKGINIDVKRQVPVVSVAFHPIGYRCKLNNVFLRWDEYGDEHYMSIEEINMMDKTLLNDPYLIIDDEEFMEAYGYSDLYNLIFEIEDLDSFYEQKRVMIESKIEKMPPKIRRSFLNRTVKYITDGKLNNYEVVRFLKSKYGIDIEM